MYDEIGFCLDETSGNPNNSNHPKVHATSVCLPISPMLQNESETCGQRSYPGFFKDQNAGTDKLKDGQFDSEFHDCIRQKTTEAKTTLLERDGDRAE